MTTTDKVTLDNFKETTGVSRFRVTKLQAARIALTGLPEDTRNSLVGMDTEAAADLLDARNAKGKALNWVGEALNLMNEGWNDSMSLTREQALEEFVSGGGVQRLQNRRPEIPDSVYFDPELTVDNFSQKVKEAIGVSRRLRVSSEQYKRIKNKEMTREEALAEIVAEKRKNKK